MTPPAHPPAALAANGEALPTLARALYQRGMLIVVSGWPLAEAGIGGRLFSYRHGLTTVA